MKYYVIQKSTGFPVKSFSTESKAREYATKSCERTNSQNFITCIYVGGMMEEI